MSRFLLQQTTGKLLYWSKVEPTSNAYALHDNVKIWNYVDTGMKDLEYNSGSGREGI